MPPILAYFATSWNLGFAIPMLVGAMLGLLNFILALALGPETKDVRNGDPTSSSPKTQPVSLKIASPAAGSR